MFNIIYLINKTTNFNVPMATVAGYRGGSKAVGQRNSHPTGVTGHPRQGNGRSGHCC